MIDLFLGVGFSHLCVSLLLACLAWMVQRKGNRPWLAHGLWLLVLVKLLTPPLISLPVLSLPGAVAPESFPMDLAGGEAAVSLNELGEAGALTTTTTSSSWFPVIKTGLAALWFAGTVLVFCITVFRVFRFHRLLIAASQPAPEPWQRRAQELAVKLGLKEAPGLFTTSAHLAPLVWWVGGKVRVVISADFMQQMEEEDLRWILAHELAHVRRRDHWVRWLEWLACVAFWWNPAVWWARRNLRANEEICCDGLVLASLKPKPTQYANSLLNAVEFLAFPAIRPPAMASGINSGGFLEKRFRMIVSAKSLRTTPRWFQATVLFGATALLPVGLIHAQEPDMEAVGKRLVQAVHAGELTGEQAEVMIAVLAQTRFAEQLEEAGRRKENRLRSTDLEEIEQWKFRIRKAVEQGEITSKEAEARLQELRRRTGRQWGERWGERQGERGGEPGARSEKLRGGRRSGVVRDSQVEYQDVEAKVKAAIRAGELSREEGIKKLESYRKRLEQEAQKSEAKGARRWGEADRRSGEANGRRRGVERRSASSDDVQAGIRNRYTQIEADIKAAVNAGQLSKEAAEKKLEEIRRVLVRRATVARDQDKIAAVAELRAKADQFKADIEAAVKAGKLSKQEAAQKHADFQKFLDEKAAVLKRAYELGEQNRRERKPPLY
ncbi:MAG: hypothetical protein DWQ01_19635 [Planctomycetota bacterium]|nr:MAG: hypothetical protein DWQ01_19635 [Planctomycetota bacterium]